jgi:hypothetical protein
VVVAVVAVASAVIAVAAVASAVTVKATASKSLFASETTNNKHLKSCVERDQTIVT